MTIFGTVKAIILMAAAQTLKITQGIRRIGTIPFRTSQMYTLAGRVSEYSEKADAHLAPPVSTWKEMQTGQSAHAAEKCRILKQGSLLHHLCTAQCNGHPSTAYIYSLASVHHNTKQLTTNATSKVSQNKNDTEHLTFSYSFQFFIYVYMS